jgi:NAD+--asparagine ADP-ribosyltransferase
MYDLFISNYAFSECDRTVQEFYIENFINTSKRGYMTCNFISSYIGVDSLTLEELQNKIKNVKIMDEIPLTHKLNKILYWNN